MTCSAGLGVLPLECGRIEPGTVGIEPPPAPRRVTGETVPLGMAGHAALEILARRLAVVQQEGLLRIMKAGASKRTTRNDSRAEVTVGTELGLAVALVAGTLATVGRRGMGREEASGMVPRRHIGGARAMALETCRAGVTGGAGLRPGGRGSGVALGEVQLMGFRPLSFDLSPLAPAGSSGRNGLDAGGGGHVAGQAALLGVTAGATRGALTRPASVPAEERRVGMARRCLELRPNCQGAWIWGQRLDRGHLRGVDVALGTEIPGMAGGARRGDRGRHTRQLSMMLGREPRLSVGGRSRKIAYRSFGELDRPDQWQVAGRAGGVGRLKVRRVNPVAGEAVGDHSAPHLHRVGTGGNVAGATWEHGVGRRRLDYCFSVLRVGEPQIAPPGLVRCLPLHGALDDAVVALLARGRGRPQGQVRIRSTSMAPDAAGEDGPVLPVVKLVLHYSAARARRCCQCTGQ
jgi:hypothetical protein